MRGQRLLGEARTMPKYRMYDCGGYPGLVESENGIAVQGELWEVDAQCVSHLDEIECVSLNLYQRRRVELQSPFEDEQVETYFYIRTVAGLVECGSCW